MIISQDRLMDIKISGDELRMICEAAVGSPSLTEKQRDLLATICHHMIWDDLGDKLENGAHPNG